MTRAPLTTDRAMLDTLIDNIQLNALPDGTAIGVALANGASRLKDSQAKSKVIVLVTDGINNAGEIDPLSAAAVCEGLGIKVYTVGVGGAHSTVPVPFPVRDPITGRTEIRKVLMNLPVDEELLQTIAKRTGGQYFLATDPESLQRIFREIDQLEKTPLQVRQYVRYREAFPPLVWAGLGLLVLPFATALLRITAEP
jgi:Ca-activated chloride channel family protein